MKGTCCDKFVPQKLKLSYHIAAFMGDRVASWLVHSCLRIERSGFEPWPGTFCGVLGQGTLLLQCLSVPHPGV